MLDPTRVIKHLSILDVVKSGSNSHALYVSHLVYKSRPIPTTSSTSHPFSASPASQPSCQTLNTSDSDTRKKQEADSKRGLLRVSECIQKQAEQKPIFHFRGQGSSHNQPRARSRKSGEVQIRDSAAVFFNGCLGLRGYGETSPTNLYFWMVRDCDQHEICLSI